MSLPWLPHIVVPARRPHHLEPAAARHDRDAHAGAMLWNGPVPADVPVTAADRARSVARCTGVGDRTSVTPPTIGQGHPTAHHDTTCHDGVLCLLTAAWVHTGGTPPRHVDVAVPRPVRTRYGAVRLRGIGVADRDVVVLGGSRVTTALATACDLLRWASRRTTESTGGLDPDAVDLAVRRLLADGVAREVVATRLLTSTRPGSRRAQEILDGIPP